MKYVLDSSVAFKWLVPEVDTPKALRLRDQFTKALLELIAPDFFPVETTHALTRAERQNRITPAQGAQLFVDLMNTLPRLHAQLPLLPRAYAISSALRVGVYDRVYVALAEREKCELVTADDKLVKNLQPHFPFLVTLSSLP
jgi:predicted nucleic acid-binding protein